MRYLDVYKDHSGTWYADLEHEDKFYSYEIDVEEYQMTYEQPISSFNGHIEYDTRSVTEYKVESITIACCLDIDTGLKDMIPTLDEEELIREINEKLEEWER